MIAFSEVLLPVFAGVLLYGVAWASWRYLLSSARSFDVPVEKRARLLMEEFLTDQESRQLSESGHLLVRSSHQPDRIYRIPAEGRWVDVYDSGKLSMRMCSRQPQQIPSGDAMLMHKFMIEGSEDEYLRSVDVRWRRVAGGEEPRPSPVSNSYGRRSMNMLAKMDGGEVARGGIYWSVKDGEFITVPREGGILEKGIGRSYIKVPLPIVLIVGPIMGIVFAFFLPLSGVIALFSALKQKMQGATVGAAGMASLQMQPGASYLQSTGHATGTESNAPATAQDDGKLVELAKEIAEKRWREK